MKSGRLALILLLLAAGSCGDPTSPSVDPVVVTIADTVTGTLVRCATCPEPPVRAVAAAPVAITNGGPLERSVVTVEAIVVNRSRRTVIARNVRPNVSFVYPETRVLPGSSLTLEAAVVVEPLPPPGDDIRFIVVVTLADGISVRQEARLVTGPAS